MNEIPVWFLLISLVVPRLVLFISYCTDNIPPNNVPFALDLLGAILIPRVLIMVYIAHNMGFCVWFWVHVVVCLIVWVYRLVQSATE